MPQHSGNEAAELSSLIGTIYDAALDPALWNNVLEKSCGFFDCYGGVIGAVDFLENVNFMEHWGYRPSDWHAYMERYFNKNPFNALAFRTRIGDITIGSQTPAFADFLASDFYKDWAKPIGIVDAIQTTVDKTASSIALYTFTRHEDAGLVGPEQRRRMELVLPHVRRSFLIGKVLDLRAVHATAFAKAIDGLATGVFLVTGEGDLVHANASGHAMLDAQDPLRLYQNALQVNDERAQATLRKAFAAASDGDAAMQSGGISVPLKGSGEDHFTAHVLPLTSGARREAGRSLSATAALFVRRASIDLAAAIDAAAQLYGMTPAEVRVLRAVIEVGGVAPVAAILGASKSTVKTHLEHLFEKTGTKRQSELVKLISGFDSPVKNSPQQPKK
jgi:DNA-binding CsgD family transcriptional regulator